MEVFGIMSEVRVQAAHPPTLLLPCGLVMCCERAWAGAAAALVLQKFSSQSHLVSFNETNAGERSVREGCSA